MKKAFILAACMFALASSVQALSWSDFDNLTGTWTGTGTEAGYTLAVTQTWDWIYDGKFLRLTSRIVATDAAGTQEIRENVGYMSFDNDRMAFVFRQFFSRGYVATYDVLVKDGGSVIDFGVRGAESAGGVRARMVITMAGDDAYQQEIELEVPRQSFETRQTLAMQRQ